MILVTGGTGLLGSHLLYKLARSGKKIRAIKRSTSNTNRVRHVFSYYYPNPDLLMKNIEWFDADLLDFGRMEDAMDEVTDVFHAGAVVSFYPSDHKAMLKVNIEGTANLVNLAVAKNIRKFCYVSSVATLGRADNDGPTDEETYWKTSKKNSVYSISKYGAEREVWRGMEEGLNAVIVNPSMIIGPGFWDDNSGLFKLVWKDLKYYTKGVNGYVDVNDIVKIMVALMESEISGQRFITSAENLSYQKVFELMARYLGKPAPSVNVPPAMTGIAWRIEAARSFIMRCKPEVTREMATITSQEYYYTNENVCKTLNFGFKPMEESIKEVCGYFLKDIGMTL